MWKYDYRRKWDEKACDYGQMQDKENWSLWSGEVRKTRWMTFLVWTVFSSLRNYYHRWMSSLISFVEFKESNANKNSGSIPRNALVACETALRVWQTDRRRTKWSLCVAMLRRRHKNYKWNFMPTVGFEPATFRSWVGCATNFTGLS